MCCSLPSHLVAWAALNMWLVLWAHHLTESSKASLLLSLPTLPVHDEQKASDRELYATRTSCVTGHAMVAGVELAIRDV